MFVQTQRSVSSDSIESIKSPPVDQPLCIANIIDNVPLEQDVVKVEEKVSTASRDPELSLINLLSLWSWSLIGQAAFFQHLVKSLRQDPLLPKSSPSHLSLVEYVPLLLVLIHIDFVSVVCQSTRY